MFAAGRPSLPADGGSRILDSIRLAIFYNGDVEITSCEAKVSSLKRRKYLSPFLIGTLQFFPCPHYMELLRAALSQIRKQDEEFSSE